MAMKVSLLDAAERLRQEALTVLDPKTQSDLGQFFTPASAASLIASMVDLPDSGHIKILDPGAGTGVLTAALAARIIKDYPDLAADFVAVERDDHVVPFLTETLRHIEESSKGRIRTQLVSADFILETVGLMPKLNLDSSFDVVIQNPPYGKLPVNSAHRKAMRIFGVDAPNLYAAFLTLSLASLKTGGQLVAITPRSFFNGPYFVDFRRHFLKHLGLSRIHVFDSRSTVFSDTGVLQENIIFSGIKNQTRDSVTLSVSENQLDVPRERVVPFSEVVHPGDPHQFIRLATDGEDTKVAEIMLSQPCTLNDLGIEVSTGKVVDFRLRESIFHRPVEGGKPLIYPSNMKSSGVVWPVVSKKPQWFLPADAKAETLLMPSGWYTLVKRFSSKEEKRRIVASIWNPTENTDPVAFENHLNVFHQKGQPLDELLAKGLGVWLNSEVVDKFFRTFSGHTQVNATDIRNMRFPDLETLRSLGAQSLTRAEEPSIKLMELIA